MEGELRRIADRLDRIEKLIEEKLKLPSPGKFMRRSEDLNELGASLAKAQLGYLPVNMDNMNTYSKIAFASANRVIEATRPSLAANGISVSQNIFDHEDGSQVLHTLMLHTSNQFIESQFRLRPNNNDEHALTSYTNWAKRVTYSALVGCAIPGEDDDSETHTAPDRKVPARGSAAKRKDLSYDVISKDHLSEMEYELEGFPNIAEQIMEYYHLQSIADLPEEKYRMAITRIREMKQQLRSN